MTETPLREERYSVKFRVTIGCAFSHAHARARAHLAVTGRVRYWNPSRLSVTKLTPLMSTSELDGTAFLLELLLTTLLVVTRLSAGASLLSKTLRNWRKLPSVSRLGCVASVFLNLLQKGLLPSDTLCEIATAAWSLERRAPRLRPSWALCVCTGRPL